MQFLVFGQNLGPGASIFEIIRYLSTPQVGLPKKSLITKIPDFEGAAPAGALAGPTVKPSKPCLLHRLQLIMHDGIVIFDGVDCKWLWW